MEVDRKQGEVLKREALSLSVRQVVASILVVGPTYQAVHRSLAVGMAYQVAVACLGVVAMVDLLANLVEEAC